MRIYVASLIFCLAQICISQVTFRIVSLPASTPPNASIYLSGNFEGWTGGQEAFRLAKNTDSLYAITLPQMAGTIQFKFTRGSVIC
jgi:alpha-glucosidase